MKSNKLVLSSKISTKFANTGKQELVYNFITEYRKAVDFYVGYIWTNKLVVHTSTSTNILDIKNQHFDTLSYLPSNVKPEETALSGRALKCAATQAMGLVGSRIKKLSKMQYVIKEKQRKNQNISKLQSKYDKLVYKLKPPKSDQVYPELNSICCNYISKKTKNFDGILVISSIGTKYGKISIPVKSTKHYNNLVYNGTAMASYLIGCNHVDFRVKMFVPDIKTNGNIEGCDQGISTTVTLSDGQITQKCNHGHDLHSILNDLKKKKKGSKAFKQKQDHRTNYINWSIKQLDLKNIKQVNIEQLKHVRKGKRNSRFMSGFTYPAIMSAMEKHCALNGVRLVQQSNAYRSQRCSQCGYVHKSNRKGKMFSCINCYMAIDADLNAALNHKAVLCDLFKTSHLPNKTTGFFWNQDGIKVDGEEIIVPLDLKLFYD